MSVSARYILSQSTGVRALGETAIRGAVGRIRKPKPLALPGPELAARVAAPSRQLVEAYVRCVGGNPAHYRETLPAHLFPHWAFLLMSRTLAGIPYPILRVVNAGCRLEIRQPLPQGLPLEVSARLESVDADERRALMTQRIITRVRGGPDSLIAWVTTFVPLGGRRKSGGADGARVTVPVDAHELEPWNLPFDAGLDYAKVAGDFNPIHWVGPYARAMGFKNPILHGFATMARAFESLNRFVFEGEPSQLRTFEVRFARPLTLPARVGLFIKDRAVYVANAAGQAPFLEGTFTPRG